MIMRRVDINGDFVFGHGQSDYFSGNDAVALLAEDRLLLWLGEWFLDVASGIDWPSILGSKPPALNEAEIAVTESVRAIAEVTAITDYAMAFDHTTFTVDMFVEVSTIYTTGVQIAFQYTFRGNQ